MITGADRLRAAWGHIPSQIALETERNNSEGNKQLANEFFMFIEFLDDELGPDWRKELLEKFDKWLESR